LQPATYEELDKKWLEPNTANKLTVKTTIGKHDIALPAGALLTVNRVTLKNSNHKTYFIDGNPEIMVKIF